MPEARLNIRENQHAGSENTRQGVRQYYASEQSLNRADAAGRADQFRTIMLPVRIIAAVTSNVAAIDH
jgi:hypothetical protein